MNEKKLKAAVIGDRAVTALYGAAGKKYLTDPYPIVIPVPDETSDGSYSKERIAANIKKAIGSDLI